MAGGLIGLITGGALGIAGNKYREKQQHKQQFQQLELKSYFDHAQQDPTIVNNPEWQKGFRKVVGDNDAAEMMLTTFKAHAGQYQRRQEALGHFLTGLAHGVAMQPSAPAGAGPGAPNAGPRMMPITQTAGAPAGAPQGQAPPAAAPAAAQPTDFGKAFQDLENAEAQLGGLNLDPAQMKQASKFIDDKRKDLTEQMKAAGKSGQITPYQQASLNLRLMEIQNSSDLRRLMMDQTKELHDEALSAKTDEQRMTLTLTHTQNLASARNALIDKLSDPKRFPDQKSRQAAADAWNQSVKRQLRTAKANGLDLGEPTDYELDVSADTPGKWPWSSPTPGAVGPAAPDAVDPAGGPTPLADKYFPPTK